MTVFALAPFVESAKSHACLEIQKSPTNPDLPEADNANITTYQYDLQGSLLKEESAGFCKQYLYNDFHQCIQTDVIRGREESAERLVQENLYDGEGLRFAIIENGKRTGFITDGWNNLTEIDGNGRVTKRIIRGMGIVSSEDTEQKEDNIFTTAYHYYHGNERMDVEFITDEAGNVVNNYTYDAFGGIISSNETIPNRYTYNGEAFDKITEQYYLRKRYYNPKLCRFTQEDEYRGDGLNLYAFCANNPVMYVDPSGKYKASEELYDYDSVGKNSSSADLKAAMVRDMTNLKYQQAKNVQTGSHQAQHIIPQEYANHPVIQATGYQVDHKENGIFAINNNSKAPDALADAITKYNISKDDVNKYVTNNTQHGSDGKSSGYHEAYSVYVGKQLDFLGEKYGLVNGMEATELQKKIDALRENGEIDKIKSEINDLNSTLRKAHQEGIDLYLVNEYNNKNKNYYEGGKSKQEAQKIYEEENFSKNKCTI